LAFFYITVSSAKHIVGDYQILTVKSVLLSLWICKGTSSPVERLLRKGGADLFATTRNQNLSF